MIRPLMTTSIALCSLSWLLISTPSVADTTLTFVDAKGKTVSSIEIKDGKIRMDADDTTPGGADGRSSVFFDNNTKAMTMIDHSSREYQIITHKSMQSMLAQVEQVHANAAPQMQEMLKQMEAQIAQMPAEQQEMMREQMAAMQQQFGNTAPAEKAQHKATGKSRKVGGYSCKVHELYRGGQKIKEACVADPAALKIPSADHQAMQAWFGFMKQMMEGLGEMAGNLAGNTGLDFYTNLDGVPVQYIDYDEDKENVQLEKVSTKTIAADKFNIPAGYKKTEMPHMQN